jgi:hypothetical protein
MKLNVVLAAVLVLSFLGCVSAKSTDIATCEQADWYELGRRDGSQGAPTDRLTKHQKECAQQLNPEWETMYTNGRNAGLVEYCDPKNAYELGRMGVSYYYVCPSTVEPQFLGGYRRGQQARELELQNQKLDEKIDDLSQKVIQTSSIYEKKELTTELDQLKVLRAKNERELSKIISK